MTVALMATLAKPSLTANSDISELLSDTKIYPNPTTGLITIDLKNNLETKVIITDIFGRKLTGNIYRQPFIKIDLKDYPDGFYMVTLINKNGNLTRKVVKTN